MPVEEIIARVEFADMIEAQPAIAARAVEIAGFQGRAELAVLAATGFGTGFVALDAAMKTGVTAILFGRHSAAI
jgi:hypothetical protein